MSNSNEMTISGKVVQLVDIYATVFVCNNLWHCIDVYRYYATTCMSLIMYLIKESFLLFLNFLFFVVDQLTNEFNILLTDAIYLEFLM